MSQISQILKISNSIHAVCTRNSYATFILKKSDGFGRQIKLPRSRCSSNDVVSSNTSTETQDHHHPVSSEYSKKISKAMTAYLDRAKQYDQFMKLQLEEYEIGRRHLANMMGADPETFTQEDIDEAIQYLMPSGLFEPKARPVFKHPSKIFLKRKAAEFDISGRPFHFLFYTARPNYYEILYDITEKILRLNKQEDKMVALGVIKAEENQRFNLSGTRFLTKEEFEHHIIESIKDKEYDQFLTCISQLAEHPYSNLEKDFITKFCIPLIAETLTMEIPPLKFDEKKRPYIEATGYRKRTVANVVVKGGGTGKMEINGSDISFFVGIQEREQIMFPLLFTGLLNKVDVEANVIGEGFTAQSGAIRHAISLALRSFLSTEEVERMRLAGLLTRDPRVRERKKPGQEGARRKYTWKKR